MTNRHGCWLVSEPPRWAPTWAVSGAGRRSQAGALGAGVAGPEVAGIALAGADGGGACTGAGRGVSGGSAAGQSTGAAAPVTKRAQGARQGPTVGKPIPFNTADVSCADSPRLDSGRCWGRQAALTRRRLGVDGAGGAGAPRAEACCDLVEVGAAGPAGPPGGKEEGRVAVVACRGGSREG